MSKQKPTPTPVVDVPKERAGEVVLRGVDLRKTFLIRKDLPPLEVLRGLDIEIRRGECLSITGESGVGKSTLLHILGLLDLPSSGQVLYRGQDVTSLSRVEQARIRNRVLGFVFQFYHLLPDLDALENAMLPGMIRHGYLAWRRHRKEIRERAEGLMEKVGLAKRLYSRPSQLSGGEQQRVALVRALLNEPEVLLCDEPTGNLDPRTAEGLRDLLFELKDNLGLTIVLVTHNQDLATRADRTVRIVDGKVLG